MTRRLFVTLLCVTLSLAAPLAQSRPADPISGIWIDGADGNSGRGLDLKYDGKGGVTGTVNPGQPNAAPISTGTYDAKTALLKLDGEAKRNNQTFKFHLEGKLEKDTLAGNYLFGTEKGTFKFTRKK